MRQFPQLDTRASIPESFDARKHSCCL